MRKICDHNVNNFGNSQNRFCTWDDFEKLLEDLNE